MSLKKMFGIVSLTTLVFALLGTGLGAALGQWAPGYYRTVFSNGDQPDFAPLQTGIGLGLTQGLVAGLVVGWITVALLIWNDKSPADDRPSEELVPRRKPRWLLQMMFGIVLSAVFAVSVVGAYHLGAVVGRYNQYVRSGNDRMDVLTPILQDERFPHVTGELSPSGRNYLRGYVADPQAREELLNQLQHAFGDATAATLIEGVTVRE